ncbi:MAG: galactose mutarotase [Paludibacteraceae bacterium]|nr:galactose mutarotase [Paludibacteraceae bacterium]
MINPDNFKSFYKKKQVVLVTLRNPNGMRVQITNYGAKIVSLYAPNQDGEFADVVLGFNTFDEWRDKETYFNAIIGRYANRIKDGKFTLDGQEYTLPHNNGENCLHGGIVGFNEKVWDIVGQTPYSVSLHLRSADGEEGFPGNVDVYVTYTLNKENGLNITYEAKTDKPTVLGFTNHAYFNLKGEGNGDIKDHTLQIWADEYTPFDSTNCPTGEIASVEGTLMDMRQPVLVGDVIDAPFFEQGRGIDNNWVLPANPEHELRKVAEVKAAGRTMEVLTTMPGLQVYTGNWVEKNIGKSGKEYDIQTAICLEAQNFPDAPNQAHFPSAVLRPGEIYFEQCEYRFK